MQLLATSCVADLYAEMRLSVRLSAGVARVSRVLVRVVDDAQSGRRQSLLQFPVSESKVRTMRSHFAEV